MFVKVKVFPDSKKQEVIRKSGDSFEIKVRESPERGEANKAVLKALSAFLKTPRIVKGLKSRNKILKVG
jgi:uncharacterized protein (TIGR00251 family)